MQIDHIRLLTADFVACFRFYRDVMGFRVTWGDEGGSYASFSDREDKKPTLALFEREAMAAEVGTSHLPTGAPAQDRAILIIGVEDVDRTVQELEARGAPVVKAPQDYPDWGIRAAYLRDPDGNLIEVNSGLAPELFSDELRYLNQKYLAE